MDKTECPMCYGKGTLDNPHMMRKDMSNKARIAKALIKEGYSFREAAKIMGYKSTRSIQLLLTKKEKPTGAKGHQKNCDCGECQLVRTLFGT